LQEQCALADCKFRFSADAEKLRRFVFNAVVIIGGQALEHRPGLTRIPDELPLVFANRAARWRFRCCAKLRSALHADKVFHRGKGVFPLASPDGAADPHYPRRDFARVTPMKASRFE
jgi:hypothetical protein